MAAPQLRSAPRIETKDFRCEFKAAGDGRISGVANAYGVKDSYGEIVDPGACKRTLDTRGPTRKMLYQHDTMRPIGLADCAETPTSLEFEGRITMKTMAGRETYALIEDGIISQMSIGYDVIKDYFDDDGTRHLAEIRLWEVSPVTFPANELAIIDAIKSFGYGPGDMGVLLSGLTSLQGEVKQGRVLSQANYNLIKQAVSILQDLLESVNQAESSGKSHLLAGAHPKDPDPAEQLSDSEYRSLMEVAKIIRQAA